MLGELWSNNEKTKPIPDKKNLQIKKWISLAKQNYKNLANYKRPFNSVVNTQHKGLCCKFYQNNFTTPQRYNIMLEFVSSLNSVIENNKYLKIVAVIDCKLNDKLECIIKKLHSRVQVIYLGKNYGISYATNIGIVELINKNCEFIFSCDDDIIFKDPNIFDEYIRHSLQYNINHLGHYPRMHNKNINIRINNGVICSSGFSGCFYMVRKLDILNKGLLPILDSKYGYEHVILTRNLTKYQYDIHNSNRLIELNGESIKNGSGIKLDTTNINKIKTKNLMPYKEFLKLIKNNSNMTIYIFGSNGMLGNYISLYLSEKYKIIPLTRNDYDLQELNITTLSELLSSKNIKENDIVINCAGVIPQASKQRGLNTRLYFTINSLFPVILGQICDKFKAKMIHITTDCVFSGKDGKYNENAVHDETNDYGISKSLGELCNGTIIRTSIIGEELRNKRSLLEWVKSNKNNEINGYTNHLWNGVTCLELAKIIDKMIAKNIFWKGIRHIYSPIPVSKYELVSIINEKYNLNIKINSFETDKPIDKTLTTIYDTNKIFNIPILNDQINEMKEYNL